jgi:hypothetical protein
MECNKWEETGMLYVSRELDEAQQTQFRSHLSMCAFCSNEISIYSHEKARFFSEEILSIQTTPELDMRIMNRCSAVRPTHVGLLSALWVKRVVFSALVFAFGAGAGGYFAFAYYHAKADVSIAVAKTRALPSPIVSSAVPSGTVAQSASSLSLDTSKPGSTPGPRAARGKNGLSPSVNNAGTSQGMITVDLKKE